MEHHFLDILERVEVETMRASTCDKEAFQKLGATRLNYGVHLIKFFSMPLTKEEFEVLKSHQYCDNRDCLKYGLVGEGNIKTHSFAVSQGYCNFCKSKPFSMRKGTMFFGLRTPVDKIVRVLHLLSSGMGQNAICRQEDVTGDSVRSWIILASDQVSSFTEYMQRDMHLEQVQIDEFWSFIREKRALDGARS